MEWTRVPVDNLTTPQACAASQKAKHELSHLYEAKIKNMGNAGRNGGEYYTPRPLIRAVIHVLKPQIGETNLGKNHRATDRTIGMAIRCIPRQIDALFTI